MIKVKKSQVTIFVIIALIIVTAIALVFIFLKDNAKIGNISASENPQAYIESCIGNNLEKIEKKLMDSNFYPELQSNYLTYYNEKIPYLCKASKFYSPCVNQEPNLAGHLREQIKNNLGAEKCFSNLINELRLKDYIVSEKTMESSVQLDKKEIIVNINKNLAINKNEEASAYEKFTIRMPSRLYSLANTANVIVNYESTICEFNNLGWMAGYPEIIIKVFKTSDGSKVYTLTDEETNEEIKFAVKTCVLPAGI